MDPNPMQFVEEDNDKKETETRKSKAHLNTWVAISVALLATFMGICKVKDDNIVKAMQQAQADKIDNYSWYQARNVREEVARATVAQRKAEEAAASPHAKPAFKERINTYEANAQARARKQKVDQ